LHSAALARELSIPTVVIPPAPGNFSAIGMLLADARLDKSKTFTGVLTTELVSSVRNAFTEMEADAAAALAKEFGAQEVFFERHAEMRYVGQRHNIKVPVSNFSDVEAIRIAFERDYKRRYGHADAKAKAEVQALHLSAFARQRRPDLASLPQISEARAQGSARPVYFGQAGKRVMANVYERSALAPGFAADGPAVIEEYGSTTLVMPGDRFEIGPLREIRIHCDGK
jgi:N-methylhydantoinase A